MKIEGPKYGRYLKEDCCTKCDYAGGHWDMGYHMPPMPISTCPECGARLSPMIGRWCYSVEVSWFGLQRDVIKHNFERGKKDASG